jgi:two-component system alkaline phosphatase synthesis response regulator PhoP
MKKILIIEDEVFLSKVLKLKFTEEGFDVSTASDGEAGLKKARENMPDLILLDLILPKLSGFEVLEKLKKDPQTKAIEVIVLSNLGQEDDVKRCKQLGAKDYLVKANWSLADVINKVKTYL